MRAHQVAVIGSTGFIGSRLVATLDRTGCTPITFNRTVPPLVRGRPAPGLRTADTIYFLAAGLTPALAERQPQRVVAERALLVDVLDTLAAEGRRPVVVLASSGGAVYASTAHPPYSESAPTTPSSAYGRAKLCLEQELARYAAAVQPVVLRLANVYGPGQRAASGYGVLAHWLAATACGDPVHLFGDPDVGRDYLHVDDVADVLLRIHREVMTGQAGALPPVVNVGSGVPTSLADLLDILRTTAGREVLVESRGPRPFDRPTNWLDITLAETTLGWRPSVALPAGIQQCWDSVHFAHLARRSRTSA